MSRTEGDDLSTCALVTVVRTEGSTYRRAGARMLVRADGSTEGSISGGCLEADAIERAREVVAAGRPRLVTYDTRAEADAIWGHGLGCNGLVEALVEPAGASALAIVRAWQQSRRHGAIATVYRSTFVLPGARVSVDGQAQRVDGIVCHETAAALLADARAVLETGRSRTCVHDLACGRVEAFVERVRPPLALVVFGAGYDAAPLVRIARELNWHVTVVDRRPALARPGLWPAADEVVCARADAARRALRLDPDTAVVVMTHNYLEDLDLLDWLLDSEATYIGLLGPKRRKARLLADLGRTDEPGRLYGPVGLDLGAESPEEIALAIAAEIQAVRGGSRLPAIGYRPRLWPTTDN